MTTKQAFGDSTHLTTLITAIILIYIMSKLFPVTLNCENLHAHSFIYYSLISKQSSVDFFLKNTTTYLIRTPVPNWVYGDSYKPWPGYIPCNRVSEQVHIVFSRCRARVVILTGIIGLGLGIFLNHTLESTDFNKSCNKKRNSDYHTYT